MADDRGAAPGALFAVRAMLSALQRATRMLARAGTGNQRSAAVREFVQRARAATATGLHLELRSGEVFLGTTAVHSNAPGCDLMTTLSALGVGAIHFDAAVTDAELRDFVALLGSDTGPCGAPEDDVVARCQLAELRHITLLPAHTQLNPAPGHRTAEPWAALPRPRRASSAAQAAVDRELEANLPAQAAQLLLADLGPDHPGVPLLERLLQAMLDRSDAAGAAWLLAQAAKSSVLDAAVAQGLRHSAAERLSSAWTTACLEGGPRQVQGLTALALELGEDAVARCLATPALLDLPEAERYLAAMIASAPAAAARAVATVDLELLPRLCRAIARTGAPLPVGETVARLSAASRAPLAELESVLGELPSGSAARADLQQVLSALPSR